VFLRAITGGRLDGSAARCDVDSVRSATAKKPPKGRVCAWPVAGPEVPVAPLLLLGWDVGYPASLPALGVGDEPASCAFKFRWMIRVNNFEVPAHRTV